MPQNSLILWLVGSLLIVLPADGADSTFRSYETLEAALEAPDSVLQSVQQVTEGPKGHWFGYYDVQQLGTDGRYLLANAVDFRHRQPRPDDSITVGMVDLKTGEWTKLGTSRAWNWQQGCRLQWRPDHPNQVMWNDRRDDELLCRFYNVETGQKRTISNAVFHVSPDGKKALSLDFARLRALRPGYGYPGIKREHVDRKAPKNTGVYRINLNSGDRELILSLARMAKFRYGDRPVPRRLYFNNLMWNPTGERFSFFLRHYSENYNWDTRVYTASGSGKQVRLIKKGGSHWDWRDPRHLLLTSGTAYRLYEDVPDGTQQLLTKAPDGHASYLPNQKDWLVSDTYPKGENREQLLFLYHIPTKRFIPLGQFHLPEAFDGPWRCDLHPRAAAHVGGTSIFFDSAHRGGKRQIYQIDISEILERYPE